MGQQLTDEVVNSKEKIVLELLGIDKKWVWSPTKKWVDITEVNIDETNSNDLEVTSNRKWWQFWKK